MRSNVSICFSGKRIATGGLGLLGMIHQPSVWDTFVSSHKFVVIYRMCLGGHLALRCAIDPRVASAVCYFATDVHSSTLGKGKKDDTITKMSSIKAELALIFGKMDNHVPPEGRVSFFDYIVPGLV